MSRLLKLLAILSATLVGLVLVALVAALSISDERYRQWTIDAVESATGRELAMDGFAIDLGEAVSFEASNVKLANAPWASEEDMLHVDRLEIMVRLFDLLRGRPAVEARIGGATLNLERNASGEANWQMAGDSGQDRDRDRDRRGGGGLGAVALVQEFVVTDTRITLDDAVSGSTRMLSVDTLGVRSGEQVEVELVGHAQDVPLALSGSLGRADQLGAAESTPLQLAGTAGDTTLDISGTWNPVLDPPRADIRLVLDLPSDAAIVALTGLEPGAVDNGRVEAHLVAGNGDYAVPTLDVRLDGERITARVNGAIGRLSPPGNIDLTVSARATEPAALLRQLGVNVVPALPATMELKGKLEGDGETIRASDVSLTTGEEGLAASASGTIAFAESGVPDLDIAFEASAPSSAALARYAGQALPELGALNTSGRLVTSTEGIALEQFVADLGGLGLDVHVEGAVASVAGFGGADLKVTARKTALDDATRDALQAFLAERGIELRPAVLGAQLEAEGRIRGDAGKLDLREWTASIRDEGAVIDVAGSIEDLLGQRLIAADVSGNIESVAALDRYTGVAVPALGAFAVSGKLVTNDAGIGIEQVAAELGGRGLDVRVQGSVANVIGLAGTDLRASAVMADLDADTVETLTALAGERGMRIPPALFAARAEIDGRVQGSLDKLDLREVTASVSDQGVSVEASGHVADVFGELLVEAEASANVDSLDTLARYTDNTLPATERLTLQASLGGGQAVSNAPFKLDLATGAIDATVEGTIGAIRSLDDMQLAFSATAGSLADFSALAQRELPANGPFRLSGRFEASDGAYALNDFALVIDDQEAAGSLTVTPGSGDDAVGSVDGRLAIGRFDLGPLVGLEEEEEEAAPDAPPPAAERGPNPETAARDDESTRLFSPEPLPLDLLRRYSGNISVTAENMTLGKTHFSNLEAEVSLADGRLTVDPLASTVDNGTLTGRMIVDATAQPPVVTAFVDMKGAAMPRFGGNLELGVDVAGEGNSVADIMAGLDGHVLVVVTGARVASSLLTSFGSDLLNNLNPLSKSKPYSEVECGILRVEIKDGIARFDDQLAAQMTETTWRGGGEVNLKDETLDVGIVPKARKGLGISVGSLASLVQVTGTLSQPVVRPDPTGLAKNYGRYVAAVSTGGLSLLAEGLRDRFQANADVCAEIRKGTMFDLPDNGVAKEGAKE